MGGAGASVWAAALRERRTGCFSPTVDYPKYKKACCGWLGVGSQEGRLGKGVTARWVQALPLIGTTIFAFEIGHCSDSSSRSD